MWRQFTVKNFRGLRNLRIGPLARLNLIAGKNNTGKTALLEALHLHTYPQDAFFPLIVNELRSPGSFPKFDLDVCGWLFHDKEPLFGAEFASEDEQGKTRTLRIWLGDAAAVRQSCAGAERLLQGSNLQRLWESDAPRSVLRTEAEGKESWAVALQDPLLGLTGMSNKTPWNGPGVFLGSMGRTPEEDVKAFSELEAANRQEEILPSLQILEPRLRRLSILVLGGKPIIHGNIGLSRQIPMSFMGEGMRRLLSIVLAMATAQGGNVLIDEIENGLHYLVLKDVWKAIGQAARQGSVQVFATTHSWECIRWAHEAFAESDVYDLRLHRLDRLGDQVSAVSYDREQIESALYNAVEVR